MKLSLYITKLIRETICKIGRKKTIEIFDIERTTLYKYENNLKYNKQNILILPSICKKYCKAHPKKDLKEVLMQGLHFYLEDILEDN